MTTVMAFGTFDGLHPGHRHYLESARSYGDELVVVVARDRNVRRLKRKRPEQKERARLAAVAGTGLADRVYLGRRFNRYKILRKQQPDVVCLGYDQAADEKELARQFAGRIVRLDAYQPDKYKSSLMGE